MGGPKLEVTRDYNLFELHEFNRPLHRDRILEESMSKHGFMPSSPIQCVRLPNGKLKIIKGHHRYDTAKRLGEQIWYIIDDTNTDIFELEGGKTGWSIIDFVHARAHAGDENCIKLIDFSKNHHIPLGAAAALVGGESAGSGNKVRQIKSGRFRMGDLTHAYQVVRVTDRFKELNIPFAATALLVQSLLLYEYPNSTSTYFCTR